jgi:deoxyribonuclease-4
MAPSSPLLLGAHTSAAGGLHRAVERIRALKGTALQVFTRNQRQWKAAPVLEAEAAAFARAREAWGDWPVAAHGSYLLNPASPDQALGERTARALAAELLRCARLGIGLACIHPGAHTGAGPERGMALAAARLDRAWDLFLELAEPGEARSAPLLLLENTAGQGTALGADFAELGGILERCGSAERLGVCLDTCHAHAAGWELRTPQGLAQSLDALDSALPGGGLERVRLLHLNDCKAPLGARRDRHEHIGLGELGEACFALVLETPKALEPGAKAGPDDLDADRRNLVLLRRLGRV